MNLSPILVVDDDKEDFEMILDAAKHIGLQRPILSFFTVKKAEQYLNDHQESPFLVLCDVRIPGESCFALRKQLAENWALRHKSVPFIYWSTIATEKQIQEACGLLSQGFFIKPATFESLCEFLASIVDYWSRSQHPKKVA